MNIEPIAVFHSPFRSKFGIPKQSGLVATLKGEIVFMPEYRHAHSLRGLEAFDYLWLIWGFSANRHASSSLMVRPPRLGGNEKVGVFASWTLFSENRDDRLGNKTRPSDSCFGCRSHEWNANL